VRAFGNGGEYLNNQTDDTPERVRAAFGTHYDRLTEIKHLRSGRGVSISSSTAVVGDSQSCTAKIRPTIPPLAHVPRSVADE